HGALQAQKRLDPAHGRVEAAASALERPERAMQLARTVEADRDREAILVEEARVFLGQERAVAGDRERDFGVLCFGELARPPRRLAQRRPVDQRLAAEEGEVQ